MTRTPGHPLRSLTLVPRAPLWLGSFVVAVPLLSRIPRLPPGIRYSSNRLIYGYP
jgi:hypothetical protein